MDVRRIEAVTMSFMPEAFLSNGKVETKVIAVNTFAVFKGQNRSRKGGDYYNLEINCLL